MDDIKTTFNWFQTLDPLEQDKLMKRFTQHSHKMCQESLDTATNSYPNYNAITRFNLFQHSVANIMMIYKENCSVPMQQIIFLDLMSILAGDLAIFLMKEWYEKAQVPEVDELKRMMDL